MGAEHDRITHQGTPSGRPGAGSRRLAGCIVVDGKAQQMCTGDAFRLCSSEIPNIPKITACMVKHRADLSAGCRTVMDRDLAQKSSKVAAE
jgi:hypothetical protein